MEHRAKSDESVTSRQSFNYAQDKQAADSRQPFGFKDVTKLSFRSNGESKMRKLIIAMLLVLIVSFAAFAGETVRVYDNKCQLKYIYDVEKGRVYDTRYQLQYIVEDNRVYDYKYQPKYIYDAEKGRIYDYGYNLQYTIQGDRVYDIRYYPGYYLERK
jgi:hypothetical protein